MARQTDLKSKMGGKEARFRGPQTPVHASSPVLSAEKAEQIKKNIVSQPLMSQRVLTIDKMPSVTQDFPIRNGPIPPERPIKEPGPVKMAPDFDTKAKVLTDLMGASIEPVKEVVSKAKEDSNMPSTVGHDLANMPERYVVKYDSMTKVWRVLDLKNPEMLKIQDLDQDIPDTHPAMIVLTEQVFGKLIEEAVRLEVLSPNVAGMGPSKETVDLLRETIRAQETDVADKKAKLEAQDKELIELKSKLAAQEKEIVTAKSAPRVQTGTEPFMLKSQVIDKLFKLAIAEGMNEIS